MELQEVYKQKMAAQMKEWNAQIELLEAQIDNAGADMAVRQTEVMQELRVKQRAAAEKMQELEKSTGEAWGQVKVTADKVWEELKTGVTEAHAKFK